MDRKGDDSKRTEECLKYSGTHKPDPNPGREGFVIFWKCPNIEDGYSDFELERYECKVCGYSYTLYYEDMA